MSHKAQLQNLHAIIQHNAYAQAVFIMLLAALCFWGRLPDALNVDEATDEYFESAIADAAVAYASVRLINASVSVIKDSQLQVQPAGVGVSLAVGQLLDPLDDMAERLSDVLVLSISSLGLQKIIYELSVLFSAKLLAYLLLLWAVSLVLGALLKSQWFMAYQPLLLKLMVIVLITRLFLPLSAGISHVLEDRFFQPRIDAAHKQITINTQSLNQLTQLSVPQSSGTFSFLDNTKNFIQEKTTQLRAVFSGLLDNAAHIIEHLLILTYLYIALFFIQVVILPLALCLLLYFTLIRKITIK